MSRVRQYVKGVDAQHAQAKAKRDLSAEKRDLLDAPVVQHDWDDKPCSSCGSAHACMRHGELRGPLVAYCFKCWKAMVGV